MTHTCATPGCSTITFGEICLGCMQRQAKDRAKVETYAQTAAERRADDRTTVTS